MSRIIAVLEMIVMLTFAWGLDYWISLLRKAALGNLNFVPMVWGVAAANMLTALMWVYLAWLVLRRNAGSRWVSLVYLLVGLLLTIILPLQLSIPESMRGSFLFDQTRYFRLGIMGVIGFTSRFTLSAAYICVLGGVSLFMPKPITNLSKIKKRYLFFGGYNQPPKG